MRDDTGFPWFGALIAAGVIAVLLRQSIFLEGKNAGLSEALDKKPGVSIEQNVQIGVGNRYKSRTDGEFCVERPECDR